MEKLYYSFKEYRELQRRSNRRSKWYEQWKYYVKKRDGFKCVKCGSKDNLNVHHVEMYSEKIDLRLKQKNGITLCRECHSKVHPWMSKPTVIVRKASADAINRLGADPAPPKGTKQPPSLVVA